MSVSIEGLRTLRVLATVIWALGILEVHTMEETAQTGSLMTLTFQIMNHAMCLKMD